MMQGRSNSVNNKNIITAAQETIRLTEDYADKDKELLFDRIFYGYLSAKFRDVERQYKITINKEKD